MFTIIYECSQATVTILKNQVVKLQQSLCSRHDLDHLLSGPLWKQFVNLVLVDGWTISMSWQSIHFYKTLYWFFVNFTSFIPILLIFLFLHICTCNLFHKAKPKTKLIKTTFTLCNFIFFLYLLDYLLLHLLKRWWRKYIWVPSHTMCKMMVWRMR